MSELNKTVEKTARTSNKPKKVNPANIVKKEPKVNSKPLNATLWTVSLLLVVGISVFNQFYEKDFNPLVRLIAVIISLALAFGAFILTNQGRRLLSFSMEAMLELKKIYWPTRKEALSTSLIVVTISIFMSFLFWFLDSVIQTVVNLITTWSF